MKKTLITLLMVLFVMSIFGVAFAAEESAYSDVPSNHWSYDALKKLSKDGITKMVPIVAVIL